MFCGRLCRAAGSGRTARFQPRRAAISRMWPARAPQATTSTSSSAFQGAGCGSGPPITGSLPQPSGPAPGPAARSEVELVDEAVVEVAAVAELDIVHLLEEGQGGGPVTDRQEGHLRALARHVA